MRYVFLFVCAINICGQFTEAHTCRLSGTTNYCYHTTCYITSNIHVGEMLTYCTSYYSYTSYNVYIQFDDNINFDLNLNDRVTSISILNNKQFIVTLNSTKVHRYLTTMYLQYNSYNIEHQFFDKFPNLGYLYASSFLNFDIPQSFTRLTRLTKLYVIPQTNSLTWKFELTNDAFRGLTSLTSIDLIRTDLKDIRYAFHGVTRLYHLGLEGNRISVLEEDIFKDLKSLTYLDLDGNGIREVSDEAFNGLTALKYLSLSGNPLFPLNTLYKLNALTALYINYNSYRTLSPEHFEQLASLQTVFADNPYFCDCSLRWTSVVSQYSLTFQTAYCLEPGKVYRTAITSASLYTNCTTDESYNCFSKTATCPTEYVCRDTASSYACTCADGFSLLTTGECVDEDECEQGKSKCEYQCNNTIGSYECSCDTGYQLSGDDRSCEDVDECAIGIAQCMSGETCVNTVGNYACRESGCVQSCENPQDHSCTCCDGFRLYNNSQCIDIDECDESIDECDMNCHNNKGSYACSCLSGFQLVNETKCIDIDECLTENGGCDDLCMNTKGGQYCYDLNITSIESLECATFGQNEYCTIEENPSCSCCGGFVMENSVCVDIDECKSSVAKCDTNCLNTKGSYHCSCDPGYQLVNETTCLDMDECLLENGGCDGLCINTIGSYYCFPLNMTTIVSLECDAFGYNKYCSLEDESSCSCCPGYTMNDSTCVDINECQESIAKCDTNCHNTEGSYHCSCNHGYQLVNETQCLDIDECLVQNGGCNTLCINTNGSYYCLDFNLATIQSLECDAFGYPTSCSVENDPTCACCSGYTVQNSACADINECNGNERLCDMNCHNTEGSYTCSCEEGFQLLQYGKCLDIDECLTNNGGCEGLCLNSNGSYTCSSLSTSSSDVNTYLLIILIILAIVLILLLIASAIVFFTFRYRVKKGMYHTVFQTNSSKRDGVYEVPSQELSENAVLLEKVNTTDVVSESSVEIYPAPIAQTIA